MARINIEDTLWADSKFMRLCALVGDEVKAAGFVVLAYRKAFKYWCPEKAPIPMEEWAISGITDHLISVGLAERRDDGIYMKGSESQFQWWFDASAKGKKSAAARIKKNGTAQPKKRSKTSNTCSTRDEQLTNRLEPLPLPPPLPLPQTQKTKELSEGQAPAESPPQSSGQLFVGTYVKAYRKRYGEKARPDLGGKTQGGIKRLLADYPIDRACEMIQVFLQMDDPWFVTKAHDFETFAQNLTKVGLALDTGKERGGVSRWEQEMLDKEKKNDVPGISGPVTATQELLR